MSKKFDIVGSFLRPKNLLEIKREIEKRDDIQFPFYNDFENYEKIEDEAIKYIVKKQIENGIKTISDGEFSKSLWHLDFVWGLSGVKRFISKEGYFFRDHDHKEDDKGSFETRRDVGIKIVNKLDGSKHHHINIYKKLENYAKGHEIKLCIPSPSHILGEFYWSKNIDYKEVYDSPKILKDDLIKSYKQFVDEFALNNGKILQLDDCLWEIFSSDNHGSPFTGENLKEGISVAHEFIDINNEIISFAKSKNLKVWTHNCRGNYRSRYMAEGTYLSIAELFLKKQNYDRFFLEWDDERAGSLKALDVFKNRDVEVVLGLLSSKTGALDNEERALEMLGEASNILGSQKLLLSHQCGFASCDNGNELTEEAQWAKIKQGIEIAYKFFGE